MRVVGIDPDTRRIGIAVLESGSASTWVLTAKGRKAEDRFGTLVTQFSEVVAGRLGAADWIYLEKPFLGPNRKAVIDQGMILGALRSILWAADIPHSCLENTTWKRLALGAGNATKDEIKQWGLLHFPSLEPTLPQDCYDAVGIAAAGQHLLGVSENTGDCTLSTRTPSKVYPMVQVGKTSVHESRLVLEKRLGRPIKEGLVAGHTCHNKRCIEPEHIVEMTYSENRLDTDIPGTGTLEEFPCGHPRSEENTAGQPYCRACSRERARKRNHALHTSP